MAFQPSDSELSDRTIVDYLRRQVDATVNDMVEFTGVTATAVRQRLTRLMEQGLVARQSEAAGRGRPMHHYSLTPAGVRSAGNNYDQLAKVLWEELRAVGDPDVRRGLLQRISARLGDLYRSDIEGATTRDRMSSLARLMAAHDLPFEVDEMRETPALTVLACPYPDLAEHDRGVCAMEKMWLADVLGDDIRLSACRLDGASCCTFEANSAAGTPSVGMG
jgi:predicted ArsR family transcriptional regulator